MARYWIYLKNEVAGPFEVEEMIRLPGFSRRSRVCAEDASGQAGEWTTAESIPELSAIFRAVDQVYDLSNAPGGVSPPKSPVSKPSPKSSPKAIPKSSPARTPVASRWQAWKPWAISGAGIVLSVSILIPLQISRAKAKALHQRRQVQAMILDHPLPSSSRYGTLRQFLEDSGVSSRWEYQKDASGLFQVMVSWPETPSDPEGLGHRVIALEANLQALSLRPLNSAGARWLVDGFTKPAPPAPPKPAAPKVNLGERLEASVLMRAEAMSDGRFQDAWKFFSARKRAEMEEGGFGEWNFVKVNEAATKKDPLHQTLLRLEEDTGTVRTAYLKQTQSKRPELLVKQRWVLEGSDWVLDEEEKRAARRAKPSNSSGAGAEAQEVSVDSAVPPSPLLRLPGLSN